MYILAEFNLLLNFNGTKEFKSRFIPFYICLFISVSTKNRNVDYPFSIFL